MAGLVYLLDCYNLYPVALTGLHDGPGYTFSSGPHTTIIDYIVADISLSPYITKCWMFDCCRQMSDHLPQSITLQVYPGSYRILCKTSYIDWKKLDDRMIEQYVMGVNLCVSSGLHKRN